mmetsp:Transcript_42937/g.81890  ORF Transcript_42937/g.81890 Transcript_42937/m.81890 type:complete len:83 (+) Transcript_42937:1540-1788(+)
MSTICIKICSRERNFGSQVGVDNAFVCCQHRMMTNNIRACSCVISDEVWQPNMPFDNIQVDPHNCVFSSYVTGDVFSEHLTR